MRALRLPTLIVALLGTSIAVADGPQTPGTASGNLEPVLVYVNAQGKITEVIPADRLSPDLTRLLRTNLEEMIHTPAYDKQGKPVSSQFVINVSLQSQPNGTGGFDTHFAYVSANPVPPGRWYWSHDANGRLGLSNQTNFARNAPPDMTIRDQYVMPGGQGGMSVGTRGH
ncbi:hypothetical protein [Dyella sp. 2HG41-7]|uniref:hypothetical protein n=1 Tax=Dyella sp. 2HG41-7 TaxID=2883239 RepID=UPI001F2A7FA1|nr:hypothetical protein [Dyella sp. 2HG41-7]